MSESNGKSNTSVREGGEGESDALADLRCSPHFHPRGKLHRCRVDVLSDAPLCDCKMSSSLRSDTDLRFTVC